MSRLAIIGGGISGLSTAFYLERFAPADTEIVLFEQSARLGGVIRSECENGFCWELGPDSFLSQKPAGMQLVEELSLTARLLNSHLRTVYVVKGGKLVLFPAGFQFFVPSQWAALARTPLLGWGAKFRALQEIMRHRAPQQEEISVADFVRGRLGREIYDYLAEPLLSGIYGGDAEQLSMAAVLPQFLAYERAHGNVIRGVVETAREISRSMNGRTSKWSVFVSFRDGMQELTDALAQRLTRTRVRRQETVSELGLDGARFQVQGEPFDGVALATSAQAASRLLQTSAPDLAGILSEIPYTSSITVSLAFRAADLPVSEGGYGFIAPRVEQRPILACSWLSAKFSHRAPEGYSYVRGFLGGARFPLLVEESDETLTQRVLDELRALMGVTAAPKAVRVARWPAAMAQPVVGHPQRIAALRQRLTFHPGLALAGNYLDGIGIPDCIRSAKAAADRLLSQKSKRRQ